MTVGLQLINATKKSCENMYAEIFFSGHRPQRQALILLMTWLLVPPRSSATMVFIIYLYILVIPLKLGWLKPQPMFRVNEHLNTLWPSETTWRPRSWSTLAQVMTKPLPEPMLTNYHWGFVGFTWVQFDRKSILDISLKITNLTHWPLGDLNKILDK